MCGRPATLSGIARTNSGSPLHAPASRHLGVDRPFVEALGGVEDARQHVEVPDCVEEESGCPSTHQTARSIVGLILERFYQCPVCSRPSQVAGADGFDGLHRDFPLGTVRASASKFSA